MPCQYDGKRYIHYVDSVYRHIQKYIAYGLMKSIYGQTDMRAFVFKYIVLPKSFGDGVIDGNVFDFLDDDNIYDQGFCVEFIACFKLKIVEIIF